MSRPLPLPLPWRATADGVELTVRLTPRGGAARIEGIAIHDGTPCLRIRVAAPPVDDAANDALIAFLAKSLGLPRSDISFRAGARSRLKHLKIDGPGVAARLETLLPGKG